MGDVIWANGDHRRIEEASNGIMKCLLTSNKALARVVNCEQRCNGDCMSVSNFKYTIFKCVTFTIFLM